MAGLNPPRINTEDPGAHEMAESSDDHFSSASEGGSAASQDHNRLSLNTSPVPITRVERIDDRAHHGEVPGTPAYKQRMHDAVPDEIEIVPEGTPSRSRSRATSRLSDADRPSTPGGTPVPKTVVERVDDKPAYGEVQGTQAYDMRKEDAEPDEVRKVDHDGEGSTEGSVHNGSHRQSRREVAEGGEVVDPDERRQAWFRSMWESGDGGKGGVADEDQGHAKPADDMLVVEEDDEPTQQQQDADDGFGDDFDEFAEEGGENDDFGDFDDGFQETDATPVEQQSEPQQVEDHTQPQPPDDCLAGLPPLDLSTCKTQDEVTEAILPYLDKIFPSKPNTEPDNTQSTSEPTHISTPQPFLSDRSLALWQQLVSPPPTAPINWTRSRIRRLFLVSLGVPVDLDEILPPSKQKRLVLPNINLLKNSDAGDSSPRPSNALDRLRQNDDAGSTTSIDSKTGEKKPSKRSKAAAGSSSRHRGVPPPPDFDLNAASLLSSTTEAAMKGWTDEELRGHLKGLEELCGQASAVLEYWLQRKDDGLKEKEALEGVIENLVGFVKGRRGK